MAKRDITIACESVSISALNRSKDVSVMLERVDVEVLLGEIIQKEHADYVSRHYTPGETFEQYQLEEWAENNGYTKQ